jgi:hypothetical protein
MTLSPALKDHRKAEHTALLAQMLMARHVILRQNRVALDSILRTNTSMDSLESVCKPRQRRPP